MGMIEMPAELPGAKKNDEQAQKEGPGARANEQKEGPVARAIEQQTAKLPSDIFLWAAGASILASLGMQLLGSRRGLLDRLRPARAPAATFIGMWAPTLLLLGIYNKIVKVAGSDRATEPSGR
jgi:hypothetical protein